jgi:Zn-dependent protease with chaperone function
MGQVMDHANKYDLNRDGVLDEHELELAMEQEAKSRWGSLNSAFATHPPTYKRLLLLRQIDQDIQSRGAQTSNIYAHV